MADIPGVIKFITSDHFQIFSYHLKFKILVLITCCNNDVPQIPQTRKMAVAIRMNIWTILFTIREPMYPKALLSHEPLLNS